MGFLGDIIGGITGKPIEAIANGVDKVVNGDKERELASAQAQVEVNKLEAQSSSLYLAGGRPFILWVCGICIALYYIPQFVGAAILWTKICWESGVLEPYPIAPHGILELTAAILGLYGSMRTIEKIKGVA